MIDAEAKIRKVNNGYIVSLRWPFGGNVIGFGEKVHMHLQEALADIAESMQTGDTDGPEIRRIVTLLRREDELK